MTKTVPHAEMLANELRNDRSFRSEWERTTIARIVAVKLVEYRSEHGLSQRGLAAILGVKQPYVARLEAAETNPELETLIRLSRTLGIEFMLDIAPPKRAPKLITRRIKDEHGTADRDGVSVTFATA